MIFYSLFIDPFHATGLFLYLLKTSEKLGFLLFSGNIGRDQWRKMGKQTNKQLSSEAIIYRCSTKSCSEKHSKRLS